MARTKNTARLRRMGAWVADFCARWNEAAAAGLTLAEFAALHDDLNYSIVTQRYFRLKNRGIVLPKLKHGSAGICHNPHGRRGKPQSKLLAPIQGEVVPASVPSFIASVDPTFSITITIGG